MTMLRSGCAPLVLLVAFAYWSSLGSRFPHHCFTGAELSIAAVQDSQLDLWYKPAPYFSLDNLTPWAASDGDGPGPASGGVPAWRAYSGLATLAVLLILVDVAAVNVASSYVFGSFPIVVTSLGFCGYAYIRTVGPRITLRGLFAVMTILAIVFAIVFRP